MERERVLVSKSFDDNISEENVVWVIKFIKSDTFFIDRSLYGKLT